MTDIEARINLALHRDGTFTGRPSGDTDGIAKLLFYLLQHGVVDRLMDGLEIRARLVEDCFPGMSIGDEVFIVGADLDAMEQDGHRVMFYVANTEDFETCFVKANQVKIL